MKKADASHGVLLCFCLNLALHFWWAVLAMVLVVLHFWMETPLLLAWAAIGVWIVLAAVLTGLVFWGNRCAAEGPDLPKENKNPYSARTEEVFRTDIREDADGQNDR